MCSKWLPFLLFFSIEGLIHLECRHFWQETFVTPFFVFLLTKPLLKRPFREDPVFKGKIKKMTVASLVSIFIPLNNIEITDHPVCRYDFSLNFLLQTNFNSLNTDGSFTMANSNSFLNPYEILTIAQETNISGFFSYFVRKLFVVCTY